MVDLLNKVPDPPLLDKPGTDGKYMPVGTKEGTKYRKIVTPEDIRKDLKMKQPDPGKLILPKDDPRYQALTEKRVCLNCIHHNKEMAAQAMQEQKFIERLLHDERYRTEWFNDFRKFGVCEIFSDGQGLRLVDGDAPAICAASDLDSTKPIDTPEGQEQLACPYWEEATDAGKLIATRHGTRGIGKRGREASNAYVEAHQRKKQYYDQVSGRKDDKAADAFKERIASSRKD